MKTIVTEEQFEELDKKFYTAIKAIEDYGNMLSSLCYTQTSSGYRSVGDLLRVANHTVLNGVNPVMYSTNEMVRRAFIAQRDLVGSKD